MSRRRLATVSPQAFTEFVAVAAVAWRVWTCVSRTIRTKRSGMKSGEKGKHRMKKMTYTQPGVGGGELGPDDYPIRFCHL
jgi:hypothetical protein